MSPPAETLGLLACPLCRSALAGDDSLRCAGCNTSYQERGGVPILTIAEIEEHKRAQQAFFDAEDSEYEVRRPEGTPRFHEWLLREKFRRALAGIPEPLSGWRVLTVCGGSGMDAEFLAEQGARVVTCDISEGAAQRALRRSQVHHFDLTSIVGDAERLPFRDRTFDLVYVHDGLHHLEDPMRGLREMLRVARRAISITEPADASVTKIASLVGVAERVEEAGNTVRRLSLAILESTLASEGFEVALAQRYGMFYRHEAGLPSRLLSLPALFNAASCGLRAANTVVGRIGNKLTVQGVRRGAA